MKRLDLYRCAREEVKRWRPSVNPGLVMAILWCFIHYVTTGETYEETFCKESPTEPEYYI